MWYDVYCFLDTKTNWEDNVVVVVGYCPPVDTNGNRYNCSSYSFGISISFEIGDMK